MTSKELMKLVSQGLTPFMEHNGYSRYSVEKFIKSEKTLQKVISFMLSRSSNGSYEVEHYLWYLMPDHNRLRAGSRKVKGLWPTISKYYTNLMPKDFDFDKVRFYTESDIPTVIHNIEQYLILYSFPYLDRFATADAIVEGFRGERDTWASQNLFDRFEVLLLDSVLKNDRTSFNRWYDETLKFCGNRKDGGAVMISDLARSLKKDYFP